MNSSWLIGGLLLGAGSSLHCIGMCGPMALMIPFGVSKKRKDIFFTIYLISKAIGYGLIGTIFSKLGSASSFFLGQQLLSILSGILILFILFSNYLKPNIGFSQIISSQLNQVIQFLKIKSSWYHYFALGLLNSLLPCTMVLVAASASLASENPLRGFMFMFCFGLGTMPALFLVKMMQSTLGKRTNLNLKYAASAVGVILSVVLLIRGLSSHSKQKDLINTISICKPTIEK